MSVLLYSDHLQAKARGITSLISPSVAILRQSTNDIPSGRQLERTPPIFEVKRNLSFNSETPKEKNIIPPNHHVTPTLPVNVTFDMNSPQNMESESFNTSVGEYPNSLVKGMGGYQWTPTDLDFIRRTQQEKKVKDLQEELNEVRRLLKNETLARDLCCASREEIHADLNKVLPCEQLLRLGKDFLCRTQSSAEVEDLEAKALFAQIKLADIQRVLEEERMEITELLVKLTEAQENGSAFREEQTRAAADHEKGILEKQKRISGLMRELSDLQSKQNDTEETYHAVQTEINALKAPKITKAEKQVVTLKVSPVQKPIPKTVWKKTMKQSNTPEVLQVSQSKRNTSTSPRPSVDEQIIHSQKALLPVSTKNVKAPEGSRQTKKNAVEARSQRALQGATSKVGSLQSSKTRTNEKTEEVAHASSSQGRGSKMPYKNKRRGDPSASQEVLQTVKNKSSTVKGPIPLEFAGKGNSQVALMVTRTDVAKKERKKNGGKQYSEALQTIHSHMDPPRGSKSPDTELNLKTQEGLQGNTNPTKATKEAPQKTVEPKSKNVVQDVRSKRSDSLKPKIVPFEENMVKNGAVQLKISKVLRKTRKTNGDSKATESLPSSTKPKVQPPQATSGQGDMGGQDTATGLRRSKRIANKVPTVK